MGFEAMSGEKEEDIASLWELIGAQRVKENRVKLTLFLKKMKNSKLFLIWRGWSKFMNKRKKEAMDEEKDAMFNSMANKMNGKKAEEVEAMLRTFLKRMQARKYVPAFNCWLELVGGRKKRGFEEQLELERQKRLAMMADLESSETAKRLRMHFARLNGKFLDMCWRGWRKFVNEEKLRNMGDDERFKRLKAFLASKLKGVKYVVFHAIIREAKDQKMAAMMNSDKLKTVACAGGKTALSTPSSELWSVRLTRHARPALQLPMQRGPRHRQRWIGKPQRLRQLRPGLRSSKPNCLTRRQDARRTSSRPPVSWVLSPISTPTKQVLRLRWHLLLTRSASCRSTHPRRQNRCLNVHYKLLQ